MQAIYNEDMLSQASFLIYHHCVPLNALLAIRNRYKSPSDMCDIPLNLNSIVCLEHLLELSRRDDSNEW